MQTRQQAELLQTGKEYEELRFRRGSPLACRVMALRALVEVSFVSSFKFVKYGGGGGTYRQIQIDIHTDPIVAWISVWLMCHFFVV